VQELRLETQAQSSIHKEAISFSTAGTPVGPGEIGFPAVCPSRRRELRTTGFPGNGRQTAEQPTPLAVMRPMPRTAVVCDGVQK
jgi:hypothetical protein